MRLVGRGESLCLCRDRPAGRPAAHGHTAIGKAVGQCPTWPPRLAALQRRARVATPERADPRTPPRRDGRRRRRYRSGARRCYPAAFVEVGGVPPAGFFARRGARSMWLALSQARILSGLRAYLLFMIASSCITSAIPSRIRRPTAAVLATPVWSSDCMSASAERIAAMSSARSATKSAGNS